MATDSAHSPNTPALASPRIRLLVLDVDGVLTDGGILIGDSGEEHKRFHVRDGCGLRIWQRLGREVAIITGRSGLALRHRLNELGIRHLINGSKDKGADFDRLCQDLGVPASATAMVGDDLPDLPVLRRCGYAIAVRDAAPEVLAVARHVTARPGGQGAVRDAIEHLLSLDGAWDDAVRLF
ncbi:MAG: HAD-IIIA family hydrolase [Phycisphaerae bacterium]|jgi:3-deoxy-D-manno-octulosonate 8-phosphate phosphatase (KDO 8-P phosphatase)|nr:HAD-IIIA family hydrolase [Phycisphaerae bacterium]